MSAAGVADSMRLWERVQAGEPGCCAESGRKFVAERDSQLWVYRGRTSALLRRYFRLSLQAGRLPSVLGGDCFRAKVSSRRSYTFEDAVIFVHDVERSLEKLDWEAQQIIVWIVLQEYSAEQTAALLGRTRGAVLRRLHVALDGLSAILLAAKLLKKDLVVEDEA